MTNEQRDHILELIDNDSHLRYRYVALKGGEPQYCVIGCMLADAGVDVISAFHRKPSNQSTSIRVQSHYLAILSGHFGLMRYEIEVLQEINDTYPTRTERQAKLKHYINSLEV